MSAKKIETCVATSYLITEGAEVVERKYLHGDVVRFLPDRLIVRRFPDGSIDVVVFGKKFDRWDMLSGLEWNASWLEGDRFIKGIESGLAALADAPEWIQELVR